MFRSFKTRRCALQTTFTNLTSDDCLYMSLLSARVLYLWPSINLNSYCCVVLCCVAVGCCVAMLCCSVVIAVLHCGVALRYCIVALHCGIALRHCIAVLHCSIALQRCIAALHCSVVLQCCIAVLHCGIVLQCCIAVPVVWCCNIVLQCCVASCVCENLHNCDTNVAKQQLHVQMQPPGHLSTVFYKNRT